MQDDHVQDPVMLLNTIYGKVIVSGLCISSLEAPRPFSPKKPGQKVHHLGEPPNAKIPHKQQNIGYSKNTLALSWKPLLI